MTTETLSRPATTAGGLDDIANAPRDGSEIMVRCRMGKERRMSFDDRYERWRGEILAEGQVLEYWLPDNALSGWRPQHH